MRKAYLRKAIIGELERWKEPVTAKDIAEVLDGCNTQPVEMELRKLRRMGIASRIDLGFPGGSAYFLTREFLEREVGIRKPIRREN